MVFNRTLTLLVNINRSKIKTRCFLQQGKILFGQKHCFTSGKKADDEGIKVIMKEKQLDENSKKLKETILTNNELEEKDSSSSTSNSSSSSDDSSSSSDSDSEEQPKTTETASKREMGVQKLNALLNSMPISGTERSSGKPLELAKPYKTVQRKQEAKKKIQKLKEIESLGVDSTIIDAVKAVADNLGGDVKQTESELLQKLREHSTQTDKKKTGEVNLNTIFLGMKIDKTREKKVKVPQTAHSDSFSVLPEEEGPTIKSLRDLKKAKRLSSLKQIDPKTRYQKIDLFGKGALNIFSKSNDLLEKDKGIQQVTTWDLLEVKEMQQLIRPPPSNAFEEMIVWTEQGKIWKFPIDNFQASEEEAKYGFHEHVFLEPLLEDGFPKKGPIRHFMELVITGLSKNPYLTVPEKHEHIDWFRNYFKEKEKLLAELGAL